MDIQEIKDKRELREARNELVVKSNVLLRKSRYTLTATEQKIIIYLIAQIKATDKEFDFVEVEMKDFCKVAGIDLIGGEYKHIKDTIKNLSDKSWWIPTDKKTEVLFRWLQTAKINKYDGTIKLKLGEELKPYLLELKENFTKYELINILALKGRNAIRLYELLKSWLYVGYWEVSIEQLKDILEIKNKYKEYRDFKNKMLIPAIDEINKYTDLQVEVKTLRTGRKITTIYFDISVKQGYQMVMPLLENQKERLD